MNVREHFTVRYMKQAGFLLLTALLIWPATSASVGAENPRRIDIRLAVHWADEAKHKFPYFDITVTNITGKPVRALDIRDRRDLIDAYCDVQIVPLDASFQFLREISDPGIIYPEDLIELAPGESLEFKSIELPIDYSQLVPGRYSANAVYRIDPFEHPYEVYMSEAIVFEVQ